MTAGGVGLTCTMRVATLRTRGTRFIGRSSGDILSTGTALRAAARHSRLATQCQQQQASAQPMTAVSHGTPSPLFRESNERNAPHPDHRTKANCGNTQKSRCIRKGPILRQVCGAIVKPGRIERFRHDDWLAGRTSLSLADHVRHLHRELDSCEPAADQKKCHGR